MSTMSCNGEGVWTDIDTTSELIDESSSCDEGERLIMDEGAINCDTYSLSVNNGSTYPEETNIPINSNCHLHHWHIQSATENLYTLTKFPPCNHVSFCEICACKFLLCPICERIVYGTVKMTCRIVQ